MQLSGVSLPAELPTAYGNAPKRGVAYGTAPNAQGETGAAGARLPRALREKHSRRALSNGCL